MCLKVPLAQDKHRDRLNGCPGNFDDPVLPRWKSPICTQERVLSKTSHKISFKCFVFFYHVFGYSSCMQTTEDLRKIQTINSCMISVGRCLSLWWNYQMYSHKTLFSLRRRLICHCITQLGYLIHFSLKGKFQEQFREIIPLSANGPQEAHFYYWDGISHYFIHIISNTQGVLGSAIFPMCNW